MKKTLLHLLLLVMPVLVSFGEVYTGKLTEEGYGKFKMFAKEQNMEVLVLMSKKATTFTPTDWRPALEDVLEVDYYVDDSKLIANSVTLLERGPKNIILESPLTVKFLEMGRAKVRVEIPQNGVSIRFDKDRKLVYEPAGWNPLPGDDVILHFHTKEARFGFNISKIITKIEKP